MAEELYVTVNEKGETFKCVKSQLMKTGGKCPVHGHDVYPEYKAVFEKQRLAKVAKLEKELAQAKGE